MSIKLNRYNVEGRIVLINPAHIVTVKFNKAAQHMGWEAVITDTNGGMHKITHPDYSALMFIAANGQDERNPV